MKKKFIGIASLAVIGALSAGVAVASIQADAATWGGFEITATSVRLGAGTKEDPSGLRFRTVASGLTEDLKAQYPDAECYTTLSFTTGGTTYSTNVPVTVWASENAWNTVLLEIPATDYGTVITAQSFIKLNETTTYETAPASSSIAKTASLVMQQTGIEDATLKTYVAGALESITLNESSGNLTAGDTVQLSATTQPAGFGVFWTSSDPSVATVDNTGKVTAVGAGEATITASMGGKSATYTVTSKMPYSVDFENGKNVYVKGSKVVTVGNVTDVAGGSKGVPLTVNGFDIDFGISAAWLANAFANPDTTGVSFKLYTTQDGNATYNGYGGAANEGLDARGTLMYMQADGSCKGVVWNAWANNNKDCPAKVDGYIPYTISRAKYESWVSAVQAAGVTSDLYISVRVGINENRQDISGFGYGVVAPGTVYIDDLKANIPVKYDPINNNPLEQDGTFENGVNALVTRFGDVVDAGVEERVAGNKAAKLYMANDKFDIYLGLNRTWLADAFDTKGAYSVTFKLYTDSDGWCEKHRWSGQAVRNGDLWYHNGTGGVSIQSNVIAQEDKVDGYIPVTLTKAQWEIFKNGDATGTSDLFIYMVLGVYNNGTRPELANDALIHDTSVGNFYIDDLTANLPAQPELKNVIDFENGANGYFGTDATANSSLVGVVDHNGDKALKFEIGNDPTFAVSLSHEYMNWVFYQQGAASVSFTVSADVALTGTYNKCQMSLLYKKSDGTYTTQDVGCDVQCAVQADGSLRMTITKQHYTTRFDENGGKGSALAGITTNEAAGSPLYCSIRINLNSASGILTKGKAFYLDDFTVNK